MIKKRNVKKREEKATSSLSVRPSAAVKTREGKADEASSVVRWSEGQTSAGVAVNQ